MMKYTWILLLLFSCQTKSTHVEAVSDTASSGQVAFPEEVAARVMLPAAPIDLAGTYVMDESRDCNLQISILKNGDAYSYELKSNKRNVKGKISFTQGASSEELYIIFLGLPGDSLTHSDEKANSTNKAAAQQQSLEALYSDGALDIQNSGNAMNSYEKFAECSDKFIHLEKKK